MRETEQHGDFFNIEQVETEVLDAIDSLLVKSEMARDERQFLNGMVRRTKPKVIVEIGVAAGGSSCIILNAIKDDPQAKLYSFDYARNYYHDAAKRVGYTVPEILPDIAEDWSRHLRGGAACFRSDKWELFTGGYPSKHLHNISGLVDLCLIDTGHFNPIEHLNILEILPYMKKNGIIILHDTALHTLWQGNLEWTLNLPGGITLWANAVAINTLRGKRIFLDSRKPALANIGAIILDDDIESMIRPLFENLALPWFNILSDDDFQTLYEHYSKHYPEEYAAMFVYYHTEQNRRLREWGGRFFSESEVQEKIRYYENSRSWRFTAFLRRLKAFLKKETPLTTPPPPPFNETGFFIEKTGQPQGRQPKTKQLRRTLAGSFIGFTPPTGGLKHRSRANAGTLFIMPDRSLDAFAAALNIPDISLKVLGVPLKDFEMPPKALGTPLKVREAPSKALGAPPKVRGAPPKGAGGAPEGSGGSPEDSGGVPEGSRGSPEGSGGAPKALGAPLKVLGTPPKTLGVPPKTLGAPPKSSGGAPESVESGGRTQGRREKFSRNQAMLIKACQPKALTIDDTIIRHSFKTGGKIGS